MKIRYYIYIIKSKNDGKIYTGLTTNLYNRLKQHNSGISGYTKGKGAWDLIWYASFDTKEKAVAFEKYLKTGSGIAFARKRFL